MSKIETILANTFESVHRVSHKSYHAEMMQYYEEVLSQSARNYAFTSDKKWEQRYIEFEKLSDKLLKDVKENTSLLNNNAGAISSSTNQLNSSVEQISTTVTEIAKGSESQAKNWFCSRNY